MGSSQHEPALQSAQSVIKLRLAMLAFRFVQGISCFVTNSMYICTERVSAAFRMRLEFV